MQGEGLLWSWFLVEERKLPVASVLSITPLAAAIEMGTGPCVHRMKHVHVRGRASVVVMSLGTLVQ